MHRVIIDTDVGIDDAHALALALKSPEIQIEGFTTVWGNTDVEHCTHNMLYMLELLGLTNIPVRQGSPISLLGGRAGQGKTVHGEKGLGDFESPECQTAVAPGNAINWLVETVMASPGEIEVIALGPQTNIALAVRIEPRWAAAVKRIIFMGGVVREHGNVGPISTANIANDPEAAHIVFNAGVPLVMVGQDVTRHTRFNAKRLERLKSSDSPLAKFLVDVSTFYARAYRKGEPHLEGFPAHDMLTIAYLLKPELFKTEHLYVDVDTGSGIARGATIADFRPTSPNQPQMHVCFGADDEAIFDLYFNHVL